MLEADEAYFKLNGEPLFSSHMLDLSEDSLEENVGTCKEYLERMAKVDLLLEMELGVTGGEEDGVDNSDVDSSKLYTQPEEVYEVYTALNAVKGGRFTIAAAFGNVHGVYAPGNVKLTPEILHNTQKYITEQARRPATALPPTPFPRASHAATPFTPAVHPRYLASHELPLSRSAGRLAPRTASPCASSSTAARARRARTSATPLRRARSR